MLDDVRVLEVSAPETMLAGRILADLGADVVVVEPPAGSAGRRLAPFLDDQPGIERSLTWHALNNNKRGVTIDLSSSDGKALMRELAKKFDVVIDAAGARRTSPLDSIEFAPRTIRCTITPFARSGPKSDYAATDFTVMAASGAPAMTGDLDRPPLFFPVPQAMLEAGADAAIATLAALLARDRDGVGQRAEVSARIAAMMGSFGQALVPGSGNPEGKRTQGAMTIAGVQVPSVYQCADGFTLITIGFGPVFGQMTQRLAKWAAEEGRMDQRIADISWPTFISDLSARKASPSDLQALVEGLKSSGPIEDQGRAGGEVAQAWSAFVAGYEHERRRRICAVSRARAFHASEARCRTRDRCARAFCAILELLDRDQTAGAEIVRTLRRDLWNGTRTFQN